MDLALWRPIGELDRFRREMDGLLKNFFGERPFLREFTGEWMPAADISETNEAVLVKAELPGLEKKDIDVRLSGDLLTIIGEKKQEKKDKDEKHHCLERYIGTFQRVFRIPTRVQADKIEAIFDKGILKITLPKTEEAKTKETRITVY